MHYLDYNEKIQHGTEDFPMAYYDVNERHPRYRMPTHWHRESELVRVRRGALRLYLGNRAFALSEGDMALIGEAVIHSGEPEGNCEYECLVMDLKRLLSPTEPGKQALRALLPASLLVLGKKQPESLRTGAEELFARFRENAVGQELSILGMLYSLLSGLLGSGTDIQRLETPERSRQKAEQLRPAIEYIETHYAQHIALDQLAKLSGMSPKYFCRCFQSIVHRTPIDYLNYFRVECACDALTATDLSVAEIAYTCGFGDSSFFIKQFKRYKGVTPRQYRRQG